MKEKRRDEKIPNALIVAGLRELSQYGIQGFSVRRVAGMCGISCATPYRYFEDKTGFILAVIEHLSDQWKLMQEQVASVYKGDARRQLTEICIANIRFRLANPNLLFLTPSSGIARDQLRALSAVSDGTSKIIDTYCEEHGISDEERRRRLFLARSAVLGAVQMIGSGEMEDSPDTEAMLRGCLDRIF